MDVLLLGPYGSGKTTQAQRLARAWGYVHFNAGQMLRDFIARPTDESLRLKETMARGELVPAHYTVDFLREAMETSPGDRFVVDGTPRALDQVALFEAAMASLHRSVLPILLTLSDEESLKRQIERRSCARCKLATTIAERACPSCGSEEFETRPDNDPAIARHRIEIYHAETDPVIAFYRERGLQEVNGEQPVEGVANDLLSIVSRNRLSHG